MIISLNFLYHLVWLLLLDTGKKTNILKPFSTCSRSGLLLFLGIILISFNLRPGFTSVGAILGLIQDDLGMTHTQLGLLTTLPLLAFSTASLFTSRLTRWVGFEMTLMIGVVMIGSGTILRGLGGIYLLYVATVIMGGGIAICNVALIPLIKNRLDQHAAMVTATYTLGMSVFSALGSGVTAPLSVNLQWGWRGGLMIWAVLTLITIPVWMIQLKSRYAPKNQNAHTVKGLNLLKYRRAWQITIFMGIQSFIFYALASWGPEILISKGFSIEESGWAIFYMQIVSLGAVYVTPILADRPGYLRYLVLIMGATFFLAFGLLLSSERWVLYLALTIMAQATGGSISLSYYLISKSTQKSENTVKLSGMAQSFGYYIAAGGPFFVGWLYDIIQDWNTILMLFFGVICFYTYFSWMSIRDGVVETD